MPVKNRFLYVEDWFQQIWGRGFHIFQNFTDISFKVNILKQSLIGICLKFPPVVLGVEENALGNIHI